MEGSLVQWIALVPLVAFGTVSMVVAVKLMLLARRTRQLPEFAISLGLLLLGVVGAPLCALGRMPGNFGTTRGSILFAAGLFVASMGIESTWVFCWSVFRRKDLRARWLLAGSSAVLFVNWSFVASLDSTGLDLNGAQAQIRPYAIVLIGVLMLGAAWSGIESYQYWGMQKKRLKLGLASPMIVERFFWWTLANVAMFLLSGTMIAGLLAGRMLMRDPLSLAILSISGSVLAMTFYLSFIPPKVYVRWVERRAFSAT